MTHMDKRMGQAPIISRRRFLEATASGAVVMAGGSIVAGCGSDERGFVPMPSGIVSRSEWGADESLRQDRNPPTLMTRVTGLYVHHSGDCAAGCVDRTGFDPRNWARALYETALQTDGGGGIKFADIPYQLLVDPESGLILEGRSPFSGRDLMAQPQGEFVGSNQGRFPQGAHIFGDNESTYAVCVLGNIQPGQMTPAAVNSVAEIFTWQCHLHGIDPMGTETVEVPAGNGIVGPPSPNPTSSGAPQVLLTVPTIRPHSDTFSTECPGAAVRDLAGIRRAVESKLMAADPAFLPSLRTGGVMAPGLSIADSFGR